MSGADEPAEIVLKELAHSAANFQLRGVTTALEVE
jgi:hypothetical protein